MLQFSSVLSRVQPFATPWTTALQASLSISYSQSLLKLMSIELVMPSNHLILSSPSPPAVNLSQHQGLFQWVSSLHQVAKVLELQLHHQSFQWIFRRVEWMISMISNIQWMISFRVDCFDLLALQGTLKSLLQHYSSKCFTMCHFIDSLQEHCYYPHFTVEETKIQEGKWLIHSHTGDNHTTLCGWDCTGIYLAPELML